VIASDSCFAKGVDHCLVSDEAHRFGVRGTKFCCLTAYRMQLRAATAIETLIQAFTQFFIVALLKSKGLGQIYSEAEVLDKKLF
jgi:hypothetical protein